MNEEHATTTHIKLKLVTKLLLKILGTVNAGIFICPVFH
jgi:hypothetical protein